MSTKPDTPWDVLTDTHCRRTALLDDVISAVKDLDRGKLRHVSSDLNHIYVHFFDNDGDDIGYLSLADALDGLWNDVFMWSGCGPDTEDGSDRDDLNLKDAMRLELQTH